MFFLDQVESIAWDLDLKTKVTREMFEKSCEDLKGRFAIPIYDAVANAGLTMVSKVFYDVLFTPPTRLRRMMCQLLFWLVVPRERR